MPLLGGPISYLKKPNDGNGLQGLLLGNESRHLGQNGLGVNTAFRQNAPS